MLQSLYDGLFDDLETLSFSPNERSWFWVIKGDDSMFAVFNLAMGKMHHQVRKHDRISYEF